MLAGVSPRAKCGEWLSAALWRFLWLAACHGGGWGCSLRGEGMDFFGKNRTSLKICGVRLREDAERLVELGVDAVGFNFWQESRRYLAPEDGRWMKGLAGEILRVGVFVNEGSDLPFRLFAGGSIDVVQLHGDEGPEVVERFVAAGIPVVKALGVKDAGDMVRAGGYGADAMLLDAYAPVVFGGTGKTFDWGLARGFMEKYPEMPVIVAGGITPENAADAVAQVRPAALDVASGAEISPGVKDFTKIKALLEACRA